MCSCRFRLTLALFYCAVTTEVHHIGDYDRCWLYSAFGFVRENHVA